MGFREEHRSIQGQGVDGMSTPFMYAIGALYLCAMVSFAYEGKIAWAGVAFSWAAGNFLIGFISQHAS